jgi:putative ABC transport system substrate-binding protein
VDRRVFIAATVASVLFARPGRGQPGSKMVRIAYLSGYSQAVDRPMLAALRAGLRELGYVEGRTIVLDTRHGEGRSERLPRLADELLALEPDVFVVSTHAAAVIAVQKVPRTMPIVMTNVQDPVASGLVKSLARPGGNITGLSDFHAASVTKRLELIKEAVPSVKLLAVLWNPESPSNASQLGDVRSAAPSLGLNVLSLPVRNRGEIDAALSKLAGAPNPALLLLGDFVLTTNMATIAKHAIDHRVVAVYTTHSWVEAGGFMAYGANFEDLYRRSAGFIDKILRGAKPGDLPIEQATKFDLIINLNTARAIGVNVPGSLLARADKVIE